jgi:hypothetical protein
LKKLKKLKRKKSEFYNEDILDRFDKSLRRDKSRDIIKGNFLLKNKIQYNEMLFDFLNSRVRDLFSDFVVKMNNKSQSLFIEGSKKKIEVRKMF